MKTRDNPAAKDKHVDGFLRDDEKPELLHLFNHKSRLDIVNYKGNYAGAELGCLRRGYTRAIW